MFVYLITNIINGKRYVGQTKQTLAHRWNGHVQKDHCRYLYNAIHKYGKQNFIIEVICEVPTLELANEFEIEYIERYRTMFPNGYNITPGGNEPKPLSEEERKKLSERMKGNKFGAGISPSEQTRKKLSLANVGKILSEQHKAKIAASHVGITPTDETRKKLSESRRKHSGPNLGKKMSDEIKHKFRLAKLGKKMSQEARLNMAAAQQARRLRESGERTGIIGESSGAISSARC